MTELKHHGIKGMKWGVRRYQNKDGSLTPAGKERGRYARNVRRNFGTTDDVNNIVRTMSKSDKIKLGASLHEDWIEKDAEIEILCNKAKTFVSKVGDTPVSFFEIWTNGTRTGQVSIGTRSGDEYRGKGYNSKVVKQGMDWVNKYGYKMMDELEWWARADNAGSNALAKKYGFQYDEEKSGKYDGVDWNYYTYQLKKNKAL